MRNIQIGTIFLLAASTWALGLGTKSLPGKDLDPVSQQEVKPLVTLCEPCHGPDGRSEREDVPVIAGKPAEYIMDSLEQYYYYERRCPEVQYTNAGGEQVTQSMCDITNALNRQEALALVRYFEKR